MEKERSLVDVWADMMRLLAADVHPAMLEACQGPIQAGASPSGEFFQRAVKALDAAQTAMGSAFRLLFRDSKVALLDFILVIGVDTFTKHFPGSDVWDEGSLLQAIEAGQWKMKDERKTRIIDSIARDRLVFGEEAQAINVLRDGNFKLYMQTGPAVHYVQRLLQVARRFLDPKQKKQVPGESCFGAKTIDSLKLIQGLLSVGVTGELDAETLARLESIQVFDKSRVKEKDSNPPKKSSAWANIINNDKFFIKFGYKDFSDFLKFYSDVMVGKPLKPGEEPEPGKLPGAYSPSIADMKRLKYILGPILKENQETFDSLKKQLDALSKQAQKFGSDAFKGKPLSMVVSGVAASGFLSWYIPAQKRVAEGKGQGLDQYVHSINDMVLGMAKFKVSSAPGKVNLFTLKGNLVSPGKSFTGAEGKTLGSSASTSFNWTRYKSDSDQPDLTVSGLTDEHLWYCEATCAHYTTSELRSHLQQGRIDKGWKVRDLKGKELKDIPISEIPALVNPTLSMKEEKISATVGVKGGHAYSPKAKQWLTHVGTDLRVKSGPVSVAMGANTRHAFKEDLPVPSPYAPLIGGVIRDLECTLQVDCLTGTNTAKSTNKLQLSAGVKNTQNVFPLGLESRVISTQAGATWTVVHQDEYSLKLSLVGSLTWEESDMKKTQNPQDVKSNLEFTGRRFTVTADATWLPRSAGPSSGLSGSLRFLYHFD
ncbi:MAG TPA: hypothetical protein VFZ09_04460 [Archangium sp.]|uniref:hypothetical protein n=1 Tax=Archangium sp. TaxID=1872627 RepID=UPI002E303CB6|nr:hypothetical protein [Archangium sp.]HEX5745473.1 hypothetical protein [Archangium sp.]